MFEEAFFDFVQQQIACAPNPDARCADMVFRYSHALVHPAILQA